MTSRAPRRRPDPPPVVVRRLIDVDLGPGCGLPVDPDTAESTGAADIADLLRLDHAVRAVDEPGTPAESVDTIVAELRYGSDLEPGTVWLYRPGPTSEVVGSVRIDLMDPPNHRIAFVHIRIEPDRRRRGHGSTLLAAALAVLPAEVRTVIGGGRHTPAMAAFLLARGFRLGSTDIPDVLPFADLDWAALDALDAVAHAAAAAYRTERVGAPASPEMLRDLLRVVAAIEDAPVSGDLTQTSFDRDAAQLRRIETAALLSGRHQHRVVARDAGTGELAGHTVVTVDADGLRASQDDTAVLPEHRGHRIGTLIKIEMMRWLAADYPQLGRIRTMTDSANTHMRAINHALGYRPGPESASYQLDRPGPTAGVLMTLGDRGSR